MTGRPSSFTQEIADEICERLAKGDPMARICEDEAMPCYTTVWKWEKDHPEFAKASAHARVSGTHFMADDCIRIADAEDIEAADKRIMIDTRIRLIGKWNARGYGDKVALTGEGGGPIRTEGRVDVSSLTPEQLRALASVRLPSDA